MTRTTGFLAAFAALAMLSGGVALGQGQGSAERLDRIFDRIDRDASGTITAAEVHAAAVAQFDALDTDGDGTLREAERRATRETRLKGIFEQADRDGDGRLDTAEVVEVAKRRALRRVERLDSDGDGMLSLEELRKVRPALSFDGTGLTSRQLEARMMAMFRRADADGDGIVTLREATDGAAR